MNSVSFVGNLVRDPELRFSGEKPRATFTVAVNEGEGDNEKAHYIDVTAFGTLGENLVKSVGRGTRVLVIGRFNTYKSAVQINGEDKDITRLSVTASAVGPDVRWATTEVSKVAPKGDNRGNDDSGSSRGASSGSGESERSSDSGRSSNGRGNTASRSSGDDNDF